MSAFPPHHSKPSTHVSATVALEYITSYLSASTTSAWLLPNATLQSTGPVAQGDSSSNLTIHNLRRVEAGLRGEWLAPTLDIVEEVAVEVAGNDAVGDEMGTEGWQDLGEYQREQSVEEGEVGQRTTAIGQEGGDEMDVDVEVGQDGPSHGTNKSDDILDKAARKAAKKARVSALKKSKGAAMARESN